MTAHKITVLMYSRLRRDRLPEPQPVSLSSYPLPYERLESEEPLDRLRARARLRQTKNRRNRHAKTQSR